MRIKQKFLIAILGVSLYAQTEMNFSYEMKYGDGKQKTSDTTDAIDYSYFENLLDINTYVTENIYVFTQFEYSDPPIFGHSTDGLESFYLEYQTDNFSVTCVVLAHGQAQHLRACTY